MISFYKYNGLGNDFIIFDGRFDNQLERNIVSNTLLIKTLCNRNFGIGADGIILVLKSDKANDVKMRIFNSDGSEPEMCGNGVRCLTKYLFEIDKDKTVFNIETLAGTINTSVDTLENIKVDMGHPYLIPEEIPTTLKLGDSGIPQGEIIIENKVFKVSSVGMGNPHLIVLNENFTDDIFYTFAPILEINELFPNKTNVHFLDVVNREKIKIKVWERGAGETLACGTGACACLVSTYLLGLTSNQVIVSLPGGDLHINWPKKEDIIYMTGPAEFIFSGKIEIKDFSNKAK